MIQKPILFFVILPTNKFDENLINSRTAAEHANNLVLLNRSVSLQLQGSVKNSLSLIMLCFNVLLLIPHFYPFACIHRFR